MSNIKYEGVIGGFSFLLRENENIIEIWGMGDNERPESYIFIKEGSIKNEKDFHAEISFWYMKNVG